MYISFIIIFFLGEKFMVMIDYSNTTSQGANGMPEIPNG